MALIPEGKIKVEPKFHKWLVSVLFDWIVIILAFLMVVYINHWITYPIAIIIIGNRQHALSILGHDAGHRLAAKNRHLNDWAGCLLTFWPVGAAMESYKDFHFAHHRHVGTKLDPELKHKGWSRPIYDLPMTRARIVSTFVVDSLCRPCFEVIRLAFDLKPYTVRDIVGITLTWGVFLAVVFWTGQWWVLVCWVIAEISTFWAFFRLRIWTEHHGTPDTHRISVIWWQRLFTPHNTWLHWEHHESPQVPFWALPELRKRIKEPPIITVMWLFGSYAQAKPMKSGAALKT